MFDHDTPLTGERLKALLSHVTWRSVVTITFFLTGLAAIGGGVYWLWADTNRLCSRQVDASPDATQSASVSFPSHNIYVDISGAVVKPGLYELPKDDRLASLVERAGGFAKNADTQYLSQELNLAKELKDGDKIYIPTKGERVATSVPITTVSTTTALTSINNATQKELEALPKIGEKTAAEIIAGRPYAALTELVEKDILSEAVFTELKDSITL
jgi:competence protein ComEA